MKSETPGKRACETPGKRACETPIHSLRGRLATPLPTPDYLTFMLRCKTRFMGVRYETVFKNNPSVHATRWHRCCIALHLYLYESFQFCEGKEDRENCFRFKLGAIDQTPYLDYSMQALKNYARSWPRNL